MLKLLASRLLAKFGYLNPSEKGDFMSDIKKKEEISRKAMHYEVLDSNIIKCKICGNECIIPEGSLSRCKSRKNEAGTLKLPTYSVASSVAVDPVEKKPLYHFYPATNVFSLGGWGCNFCCIHCQNWQISQPATKISRGSYYITPEEAVQLTLNHHARGICWTYNEPAIWYEYTLDSARLAREAGLYTAYVTNGFLNEKPLREIAPYLDAYRVDFKGFSDKLYHELCSIKNWQIIYKNAALARELGMHVEVVTNIVPEYNDDNETLKAIAEFTVKNIGPDTPWHISRFFPNNKLNSIPPTPMETIEKAYNIGKEAGLYFIYKGNCPGKSDTICPDCQTTAIERNFSVKMNINPDGTCKRCGKNLNVRC
jgi:pyruvate formate lyase activating enzyme